jgi:hypothetical protein
MYKVDTRKKSARRRAVFWLVIILLCLAIIGIGVNKVRLALKPQTAIQQSTAKQTKVSYDSQLQHYTEPDFTIDIPKSWAAVPRPVGPYASYTWQISDSGAAGQTITVYEDTIPTHFAVNRVLIVSGETDHLTINGNVSDNCAQYTNGALATADQIGAPAKWQGVDFLCDKANTERDVIGTSSLDGINTVIMKNQSTGQNHKFFFTYTDTKINPDYSVFLNALSSLKMQ